MSNNNNNHNAAVGGSQGNAYADNNAYKQNNAYASGADPYARKNQQAERLEEKKLKGFWALDFEIVRFFRENYNAGIDLEDSPRDFFDAEYIFGLRVKLLVRNFTTIIFKFFSMSLFSLAVLFLTIKGILLLGFIYTALFLYYIAVPIAFVKYTRQYILDDTDKGRLREIHEVYSSWFKPLEVIAMNIFTIFFIVAQSFIFLKAEAVASMLKDFFLDHFNNHAVVNYISNIDASDIKSSAFLALCFYVVSYAIYYLFIHKIWTPRWEKKRKENELAYKRATQRTARSLRDALVKGE